MINRFDTPAQSEFIDTYIPIPFQELSQASQTLQNRHQAGVNALDEAYAAAQSINAIPTATEGDVMIRDQIVKGLSDIVEKYSKVDLADENAMRNLKMEVRAAAPMAEISRLEGNYAAWTEAKKMKQQLTMQGRYNSLLDEDPANNKTFGANGEVYDYTPGGYDSKEKELMNYMGMLKEATYKGFDPLTGLVKSGRDQSDIDKVVGDLASEYAGTVSGQNEIKLFKKLYDEEVKEKNMSDLDIAKKVMSDFGQQFIRDEVKGTPGYTPQRMGGYGGFGQQDQGMSTYTGATVVKKNKHQLLKEIEEKKANLAMMQRQGSDDPVLVNEIAEYEEIVADGLKQKNKFYNDTLKSEKTLGEDVIKNFKFISGPQEDEVVNLFQSFINKHMNDHITDSSEGRTDASFVVKTYPGEDQFKERLSKIGLKRNEIRRVTKQYRNFFESKENIEHDANVFENDYIGEQASKLTQEREVVTQPYYEEDGVLQYNQYAGSDRQGQPTYKKAASYISVIQDNISNNHAAYEIEGDGDTNRSKEIGSLLKGMSKGELGIDPRRSRISFNLDGGAITMRAGVYKKGKNNEYAPKEEGDIKIRITSPDAKAAIQNELWLRNNHEAAYSVSPMAHGVESRVLRADFRDTKVQEIELEHNMTATIIKQEDGNFAAHVFDKGGEPILDGRGKPIVYTKDSLPELAIDLNGAVYQMSMNEGGAFMNYSWR